MKDYVKCNNCGFIGLVDIGKNYCPTCHKDGCLSWVDEDNQEVSDDFLDEKVE